MSKAQNVVGPKAQALLNSGVMWEEDGAVVAKASDGVIVSIGHIYNWAAIEAYLTSYPTPDVW